MKQLKLNTVGFYWAHWNTLYKFVSAGPPLNAIPGQITFHTFPAIWLISKTCNDSPAVPETSQNENRECTYSRYCILMLLAFFMCEAKRER